MTSERSARSRSRGAAVVVFVVLCCLALPLAPLPDFYIEQAFVLFFYIALAQSWNVLGGYSGYLSLGHAAFVGMGGYTVASLYFLFRLSPFLTFPLGGVGAAIVALIIGAICFRIRGSYFLIATMLVLFIMQSLALNLRPLTNGPDGIDLPLFTDDFALEGKIWYFCGLALAVSTSAVAFAIERSRFGLNLMAIREDEDVARAMGVRVIHCKAAAFVISAALAGVAGAFYTYRAHIIEPFTAFSLDLAAAPILMSILGGSRNWIGPVVGATIFDIISTTLKLSVGNEYSDIVFALFLVVVVLLLPQGLVGLAATLRRPRREAGGASVPDGDAVGAPRK
jgi:branched-chain amino acid transport system permease protein